MTIPYERSPSSPNGHRLEIVGFGEAMVLVTPADGQPLEYASTASLHVAGAELNLCAAAARLGARAAFCTRVGADPFGRRVIAAAERLGVDTALLAVDPVRPTGVYFKDVHTDGARRVYYYRAGSAASTMDATDAGRLLAARPALVVVSGITASLGPGPLAAVRAVLRDARTQGTRVVLDPNLRPTLAPVEEQVARIGPLLGDVDILLLGLDEAEPVFGTADPDGVFAAARTAGVGETVLKAGPDGCYVVGPDGLVRLPSAATVVVDPVGAGDAFAGGYLVGRLRGLDPVRAAWLGTQLAAGVLTRPGDTEGLPDLVRAAAMLAEAGTR
jgi:2-dehydro-3-deoxygluconokinase